MIDIVRSKLEASAYASPDSLDQLRKLLGISQFVISDKAMEYFPTYPECVHAIEKISTLYNNQAGPAYRQAGPDRQAGAADRAAFNETKMTALAVFDRLIKFLETVDENSVGTFYGEIKTRSSKELDYHLLMIEQEHLDYFRDRRSHLPTQPHDRLFLHYWTYQSGDTITFGFFENSTLPENIRTQVIDAFKKVSSRHGSRR